jgi:hypothetical protein
MRASIGGLRKVIGTMIAAMQDRWGVPLSAKCPIRRLLSGKWKA